MELTQMCKLKSKNVNSGD